MLAAVGLLIAELGVLPGPLHLEGCGRIFLDGGSNDGDSVKSFLSGGFHNCALHGPNRLYGAAWVKQPGSVRREMMRPLREPSTFCVRSFEANPRLLPLLRALEPTLLQPAGATSPRAKSLRFVGGALGNVSSASAPLDIVTYSKSPWGSTATTFAFEDIHAQTPKVQRYERATDVSYDV